MKHSYEIHLFNACFKAIYKIHVVQISRRLTLSTGYALRLLTLVGLEPDRSRQRGFEHEFEWQPLQATEFLAVQSVGQPNSVPLSEVEADAFFSRDEHLRVS